MGGPSRFFENRFRKGEGGLVFSPWAFLGFLACSVGVCRGFCSLSCCRFRAGSAGGAAFGPLSGRALGRRRPGVVVAPVAAGAVRVRRRGAVFLARRRRGVRPLLGSPPAGPPRFLRGAPGGLRGARVLVRVGAGLPVLAALPLRSGRPGGRSRRCRRAVRPGRLGGRSFPARGRSPAAFPLEVFRGSFGFPSLPLLSRRCWRRSFRPPRSRSRAGGCPPRGDRRRLAPPGVAARSAGAVRPALAVPPGAGFRPVPLGRAAALFVVSPLLVFAAGLPPGGVPWSPWPARPGVLLVACPSRPVAEHCRRRAAAFGLAVAGPLPVSRSRWLVAVAAPGSPAPDPLSVRLGAGPAVLAAPRSLAGVPLPVPPRGGFSRSPLRSTPAVSLRQGRLF